MLEWSWKDEAAERLIELGDADAIGHIRNNILAPVVSRLAQKQKSENDWSRSSGLWGVPPPLWSVAEPTQTHILVSYLEGIVIEAVQRLASGHKYTFEQWSDSEGFSGVSGDWADLLDRIQKPVDALYHVRDPTVLPRLQRLLQIIPSSIVSVSGTSFRPRGTVEANEMRRPIEHLVIKLQKT